jgi:hypothetical protein
MLLAGVQAFLAGTAPPSNAALGQHLLLENLGRAASLAGWEGAAGADAGSGMLRPDAVETVTGVARYLREAALPAVQDARVRRELKTAAALLEAAALRVPAEAGAGELELEAVRAERERSPARFALRARLLAGLAEQRALIRPLEELYR